MIKVGLFGFGRTGKSVASALAKSKKVDLRWVARRTKSVDIIDAIFENPIPKPIRAYCLEEFSVEKILEIDPVDIIVDFSSEDGINYYGDAAIKNKITVISAISQYLQDGIDKINEISKFTRVLYSPNITLGVNFLLIAAKILKNIAPHADIEIIEEHFKQKSETSGTGKIIADHLDINHSDIKSIRAGGIIGKHEILFGFPHQTIRMEHESISREAFGTGVLFAIKNLPSVSFGLFTMEDLLKPYFKID